MCWKTKLFAVKFRRILEVLYLQELQKKFCAHFHDPCVQIWSCFVRSSDSFWKLSPCEVYKNSSGRIITTFASKNEVVCRDVQTDFGSFPSASFIKKIGARFLDLCVQKWSCLLLSSDTFWKFLPMRFMKKFWAHFHDWCVQKRLCWPWSSDAFWKFSACKFCRKISWRIITIYTSKYEAICC